MHESLVVLSSSPQPTSIAALAKFLRNMCQFPSKKMEIHGEILYKLAYLSPTAIIKVYGVTQENDTCCCRVVQKIRIFSFPILAFFIVNNMEKYSHTQKISSKS